jgi:uncharacterized protein (TIGR00730 family)
MSQREKKNRGDAVNGELIDAIKNDPSYLQADLDADFLRKEEVRGVRLQIDYLKPELVLGEYGIENTIVVFGGTRIVEPDVARRTCDALESELDENPDDDELVRRLSIARRIESKSKYYEICRELGALVGQFGMGPGDSRVTLMTGGGPGIMEAANRGAHDVGAKSIGLNITLPYEQHPNPYVTPGLAFSFHYFGMRKLHLLKRAKALVAFPGGFGTLDEVFETLTLVQTSKIEPLPIVLMGKSFWESTINFASLVEEGVVDPEDVELFSIAESAQEAWDYVLAWYLERGSPLGGKERRENSRREDDH